jgi:hypothetical protein
MDSRYYNPEWGRFISLADVSALNPQSINGLNLYAYAGNNSIKAISSSLTASNHIESTSNYITNSKSNSITNSPNMFAFFGGLHLFGYELRESAGWNTSPEIATGYFGRVGFSSYVTNASGREGVFYAFAGSTSNIMNFLRTTYYAGVGINAFGIIGAEVQLETLGIGAQINLGSFSIGANVNLIGGTSITLGWNTTLGNGLTRTDGFTIGINTFFLVAVAACLYKFVMTGDTSPIPGLEPV